MLCVSVEGMPFPSFFTFCLLQYHFSVVKFLIILTPYNVCHVKQAPSTTTVSSVSSLGTNHTKPGSSTGDIFPERPNEPDCQYYLKTGTCKYTSSCKYNHPKGATQPTDCIIGPYGLPHRPVILYLQNCVIYLCSI